MYTLQESELEESDSEGEGSWESDDSASSGWKRQQSNGNGRFSVPRGKSATPIPANGNTSTTNNNNNNNSTSSPQQQQQQNGTRKRMSVITNKYFEVPTYRNGYDHFECGAPSSKNSKRKFFGYLEQKVQLGSLVDVGSEIVMRDALLPIGRTLNLSGVMERGGKEKEGEAAGEEDWDDGGSNAHMVVDS